MSAEHGGIVVSTKRPIVNSCDVSVFVVPSIVDVLQGLHSGGSYMPHIVAYWLHNMTREGAGPLYTPSFLSLVKS
jgi:hypothetical protein